MMRIPDNRGFREILQVELKRPLHREVLTVSMEKVDDPQGFVRKTLRGIFEASLE
jgi:hypothetical protein